MEGVAFKDLRCLCSPPRTPHISTWSLWQKNWGRALAALCSYESLCLSVCLYVCVRLWFSVCMCLSVCWCDSWCIPWQWRSRTSAYTHRMLAEMPVCLSRKYI